jgi:hypothetical protein
MLQTRAWSIVTWEFSPRLTLHGPQQDFILDMYVQDEVLFRTSSKRVDLRGYMWGCVRSTETQRIRTASKFLGPSAGHSESAFCSSVTKVAQFIFLQTSQIALTIDAETLSLSIIVEKTHGSPTEHGLVICLPPYLPPCQFFWILRTRFRFRFH